MSDLGAETLLLASMEVRIGTTLAGHPAGFDTASTRPLLLVGDGGRGKTTTVRHLTRWWLANTTRHAHVLAANPSEWADLRCHRAGLDDLTAPMARECRTEACLVVVDDLEQFEQCPEPGMARLPLATARVVLTCHGINPNQLTPLNRLDDGFSALGLVPRHPWTAAEAAVLEGQGRLDWPTSTVPIVPDQRGPLDFPCHRWHAPATEWIGAAG